MYQPWGKDPDADIINLIEEEQRKQVNYSSYENDSGNWNIVRYKEGRVAQRDTLQLEVNQETTGEHWRLGQGQVALKAQQCCNHSGSIQPAVKPIKSWGSKIADVLNKELRTDIDVELTVKKRSNIYTNPQRYKKKRARSRSQSLPRNKKLQRRSRSRSQSLPRDKKLDQYSRSRSRSVPRDRKLHRHSRSRSQSIPRNRKVYRHSHSRSQSLSRDKKPQQCSRSRSHSRSKKRRSCSRIISRDGSRSVSRDEKRERSDSRDRKRLRKANNNDRHISRTRSIERSLRKRSLTPKAQEIPVENTNEILSKFISIIQDATKEQPALPAQAKPNPNVLPEFDSNNNSHSIVSWLLRVDDVARLLEWDDKETMQYALPKLVGDAKTWYQTLETVPNTWAEWRKTLKEQFPSSSFPRLLMDMYKRYTKPFETLENYYYAKMLLINKCGFKGRYAVECLLAGVNAEAIRLCGEVADFSEPEEVLKYLKSVETVWLENMPPKTNILAKAELAAQKALKQKNYIICFRCGKHGHKGTICRTRIPNANTNPIFSKTAFQMASESIVQCGFQQYVPPLFQPRPRFKPHQQFRPTPPFLQAKKPCKTKELKDKLCHSCNIAGHLAHQCPTRNQQPMTSTNDIVSVTDTIVEASRSYSTPDYLELTPDVE